MSTIPITELDCRPPRGMIKAEGDKTPLAGRGEAMLWIKGDALDEFIKTYSRVSSELVRTGRTFQELGIGPNTPLYPLATMSRHASDIGLSLRSLSASRKGSQPLEVHQTVLLLGVVWSLEGDLREAARKLPPHLRESRSLSRRLAGLHKEVNRLYAAALRLHTDAMAMRDSRDEEDPIYEECRLLRTEIARLDKAIASDLKLPDLADWMARMPSVELGDARHLKGLAKVYVLDRVPFQMWELRYRSEKPGRPLLLLTETTGLPDAEMLDYCERQYGHQEQYIIAARLPRWKVVWQYHPHGLGA